MQDLKYRMGNSSKQSYSPFYQFYHQKETELIWITCILHLHFSLSHILEYLFYRERGLLLCSSVFWQTSVKFRIQRHTYIREYKQLIFSIKCVDLRFTRHLQYHRRSYCTMTRFFLLERYSFPAIKSQLSYQILRNINILGKLYPFFLL